jgi:NitT/TauT family transport system substrate-binding protein
MGGSAYLYLAKKRGFFSKRGIDLDILRGNGSLATSVAIGTGKFDFGLVQMPTTVIGAMGGMPIQCVAIGQYSLTLGVGVLANSPIKTPKDLEGKTVSAVPTSGDAPFRKLYSERAGFDLSKVNILNVDFALLEQLVMQKKVDAMFAVANTSLPPCVSNGYDVRFMLFSDVGLDFYGTSITANRDVVQRRPETVQKIVDAALEGIAATLLEPDAALEALIELNPEIGIAKNGREFSRLGIGIFNMSIMAKETTAKGLGWADFERLDDMMGLITTYLAKSGSTRPDPKAIFTNDFVGKMALSPAQWDTAKKNIEPFRKYISG